MLEEDYYLANFRSLIEFVGKTYKGLLSEAEIRWLDAIVGLPEPAQRLYVRLSNRRSSVFRVGKLKYPEIDSIASAAQWLVSANLASTDAPTDISVLVQAFTKPALIKRLELQSYRALSRRDLETHIVDSDTQADIQTLQQADQWITVKGFDEYTVFKLCFFGNGYQDMSEFVLRDLGVFTYEQYRIDERSRVFQSREQIEAHLEYFACANLLGEADQTDMAALLNVNEALPANKLHDPHLTRRVDRMRNRLARQMERLDEAEQALNLYKCSDKPPSRERQVRLLMKLSQFEKAQTLCAAIIEEPIADEEVQFVETITPKLNKQLGLPPVKRRSFRPITNKVTLTPGEARVEFIARDFYSQYGDCFYVENALVNGVLGLFIWDIIFAPVKGVFYNPFQSAPADFYQPEFCDNRRELLDQRLKELDDPLKFSARVFDCYASRQGIANPLVSWRYLSEDLLSFALMRIPVADWRALFDRILKDLRNHTTGLPDLILFPTGGSYEMLEIKGPGDAVQKNQRRWMAYFAQYRIPYRVVHIRWAAQAT